MAEAMLAAVAVPHAAGLVHRDIKPENMCLAASATGWDAGGGHAPSEAAPAAAPTITLVDYGGATVPGRPVRQRDRLFYGTPMYAGLAALRGEAPCPWDDLESLGYW
jgi:serine/threonine protein kinase